MQGDISPTPPKDMSSSHCPAYLLVLGPLSHLHFTIGVMGVSIYGTAIGVSMCIQVHGADCCHHVNVLVYLHEAECFISTYAWDFPTINWYGLRLWHWNSRVTVSAQDSINLTTWDLDTRNTASLSGESGCSLRISLFAIRLLRTSFSCLPNLWTGGCRSGG